MTIGMPADQYATWKQQGATELTFGDVGDQPIGGTVNAGLPPVEGTANVAPPAPPGGYADVLARLGITPTPGMESGGPPAGMTQTAPPPLGGQGEPFAPPGPSGGVTPGDIGAMATGGGRFLEPIIGSNPLERLPSWAQPAAEAATAPINLLFGAGGAVPLAKAVASTVGGTVLPQVLRPLNERTGKLETPLTIAESLVGGAAGYGAASRLLNGKTLAELPGSSGAAVTSGGEAEAQRLAANTLRRQVSEFDSFPAEVAVNWGHGTSTMGLPPSVVDAVEKMGAKLSIIRHANGTFTVVDKATGAAQVFGNAEKAVRYTQDVAAEAIKRQNAFIDAGAPLADLAELPGSMGTGAAVRGLERRGVAEIAGARPAPVTASATEQLFGLQEPQPLSKVDEALNALRRTTGIGVEENAVATPIMRQRAATQSAIESQAGRLGALADDAARVFETDKFGRVPSLPGAPTIQDIAARLPQYQSALTPKQIEALSRLRANVEPFGQSLAENGVEIGSRPDVMQGGFYLPRGRADLEGADAAVKVYAGRGMAGAKKGFERPTVFDSMSEGIDAGYQYAPFKDALQSYARAAGQRAIDARAITAFKTATDEAGNLLGQTPHARLLEQNPQIASRVEGLRKSLQSLRGTAARLTDKQQVAIDEFLLSPAPDLDTLRDALDVKIGVNAVGNVGPNYGKNVGQVRQTITDIRQQIRDLSPEWHKALERARLTPRDQGAIGFSGLQGTSFPDEVANAANKFLNAERPPTGKFSVPIKAANAVNSLLRGVRATADVSFMGIQGLLGLVRDPAAYGKALNVAMRSMGDENALGAYFRNFDDAALKSGRPTSQFWASQGTRFGGVETEFQIGRGVRGLSSAIGNLPIIRQANRSFGYFGDVLRNELDDGFYQAATRGGKRVLSPEEIAQIAHVSNLMTGWGPRRFLGDLGELTTFAPRYFQAQLDLITKAATSGGLDGQIARGTLVRLVGLGTLATVAANELMGNTLDYRSPFIDGKFNPNFMRIRVAGQDISLFGPWDSLLRAVVNTAQGDPTYLMRSKSSPLVGEAWDLISGKTFTGKDARDPQQILRGLLPFSLAQVGQEGAAGTAIGLTGLKTTPLSMTDRLDEAAQKQFPGKGFYGLEKNQQQAILKANPDLAQAKAENAGPETKLANQFRADYATKQATLDAQLISGEKSPQQWRDQRGSNMDFLRGQLDALYAGKPAKSAADKTPVDRFYDAIKASSDGGKVDWDKVDTWVASQSAPDQAYIERNTGLGGTPTEQRYRATTKALADAGFFDIRDQIMQQFAPQIGLRPGKAEDVLSEAERQLRAQGNPQVMVDLQMNRITQVFDRYVGAARLQWEAQHPELARYANAWGFLSTSKRNAGILMGASQ